MCRLRDKTPHKAIAVHKSKGLHLICWKIGFFFILITLESRRLPGIGGVVCATAHKTVEGDFTANCGLLAEVGELIEFFGFTNVFALLNNSVDCNIEMIQGNVSFSLGTVVL